MSESTLTAAFNDLQGDLGFFLGFGRGPAFGEPAWDARAQASITRCVKGGLRDFYFCGHAWSFLQPVKTFTLPSGQQFLPLPDDCGGVEGRITFTTTAGRQWRPIDFGGIGAVYEAYARLPTQTGWPELCCIEAIKGTTINRGNRMHLHFWPIPDQDYTIQFRYYISPDYLSGAFPYAYGGPQHAETLLSACKAVAERDLDDMAQGPQQMNFQARLAISMELDARQKPECLGYNADNSDWLYEGRRSWGTGRDPWLDQIATYDGVTYGGST